MGFLTGVFLFSQKQIEGRSLSHEQLICLAAI
jgi:hypothetical protein